MSENSKEEEGRRKNGLQRPWDLLQIGTWVLYPLVLAQYFGLLLPLMWTQKPAQIILTFFFCLGSVTAVYSGYLTCAIDPADDAVLSEEERDMRRILPGCLVYLAFTKPTKNQLPASIVNDSDGDSQQNKNENETIYCYLCEEDVCNHSKHCRYCNKCVQRFDHHCKWLNTCVGEKNYRFFLCVVGSVTLQTTISVGVSLFYLVVAFAYSDTFGRTVSGALLPISSQATSSLLVVSVALLVPLVTMVYQLMLFHMTLVRRGLTTYDFIVAEQKRAREKKEERTRRKQSKGAKSRGDVEMQKEQQPAEHHQPVAADDDSGDES